MNRAVQIAIALLFTLSYLSPLSGQGWDGLLTPLNQHDPSRRIVFTLLIEESGAVADIAWQESMEARFAILQDFQKAQEYAFHGAFLRLKPKQAISFYPKEVVAYGKGRNSDETCSWSFSIRDDEETSGCGGSGSTRHNPLADVAYATLHRTEEGAILKVQLIATERCCIWTSADSLGRSKSDQRLFEFKLTNDELRNWRGVRQANSGVVQGCEGCDSGYTANLTITLVAASLDDVDDPKVKVALDGCLDLPLRGEGTAAARGEPGGGTYRFRSEPSSLLSIRSDGAAATVRCMEPGRGRLHVEYRKGESERAEGSVRASCVEFRSVNKGEPLPPVALFDEEGRRLTAVGNVSAEITPSDGADLLVYVPADPSIGTAVGLGAIVQVMGMREGETAMTARTRCGGRVGPEFQMEVVRCDEAVVKRLAHDRETIDAFLRHIEKEIGRVYASKEFDLATNHLASSTADLAIKTAVTVASALGPVKGIAGMSDLGVADNLKDVLGASLADDSDGQKLDKQISSGLGLLVGAKGTPRQQRFANLASLISASKAFADALGAAITVSEIIEHWKPLHDEWFRKLEDNVRQQRNCRSERRRDADIQAVSLPPQSAPRRGGFPYEEGGCGCTEKLLGPDAQGLGEMKRGLMTMKECNEGFRSETLEPFERTLGRWYAMLDRLEAAASGGRETWKAAALEELTELETLKIEMEEFGRKGAEFEAKLESCSSMADDVRELVSAIPLREQKE
jgi:hypothetical protein